jgi:hypothetical protein
MVPSRLLVFYKQIINIAAVADPTNVQIRSAQLAV